MLLFDLEQRVLGEYGERAIPSPCKTENEELF